MSLLVHVPVFLWLLQLTSMFVRCISRIFSNSAAIGPHNMLINTTFGLLCRHTFNELKWPGHCSWLLPL